MSRKRVLTIALPVIAVLAIAGGAIAATKPVQATATSVSAEFSATSVSKVHTVKCTAKSGDVFQQTSAIYKGTATSTDARLTGPITIKATSFLDTTSGLGRLAGSFAIVNSSKKNAVGGSISGVISGGSLSGLATGAAKGPSGLLIATFGGTFDQATGFQAGSIGSATTGGGVVLHGSCPVPKKHKK